MGLFGSKPKLQPIDTNTSYTNNVTGCLEMYKNPAIKDRQVFLKASSDPKFVDIHVSGVNDVAGVITRDETNVVTNIGLYIGRGLLNAFTPDSTSVVTRYVGKALDIVPPAYK